MLKLKTMIILMSVIILLSHRSSIYNDKTVLFGLNISYSTLSTNSSQYIVTINQTFGGPLLDYSYSVISTSDGGYVLAGYTHSYGAGESDMWLVKTNVLGQCEWDQTIGGTNADFGSTIIEAANGGYIIVGGTAS